MIACDPVDRLSVGIFFCECSYCDECSKSIGGARENQGVNCRSLRSLLLEDRIIRCSTKSC